MPTGLAGLASLLDPSSALRLLGRLGIDADPRNWRAESPTEALALGVHALRSGLFAAESLPLLWIERPSGGARTPPPKDALETTVSRLRELLSREARAIGEGRMPLSVLTPRDPVGHTARWLRVLADSASIAGRRRQHQSKEFRESAAGWLEDLPAYYRRNFHYQTDGYLSEKSADLYEHQVEMLFRGGADAMRRLILEPLRREFGAGSGKGLRFLELGSGTGIASRFVRLAFPEAKICCLDLSYPYMKHAQKSLRGFDRIDFVQGDAAALDFDEGTFDAVYSVFLFHELPLTVREAVVEEARRVLRPGGFFGFVDSLQKGDDPELDWALDAFPRQFHEPYFAHYAANPMESLIQKAGFDDIETETGYLAKVVSARSQSAE